MNYRITVRHILEVLLCSSLFMLFISVTGPCLAQDVQVVRVEEDWKMLLGDPEPQSVAPQVTCVISPVANVDSLYAAFTLNHRGLPNFNPGGLQLQVWDNETPLSIKNSANTSILSKSGEPVTWTQSMELKDGALTFEILNGNSATWGEFGGNGELKASVNTALPNLNNYSPDVSVKNSSIGFASNRVQSLVLNRVRLITSTGKIIEDKTVRIVYPQQE